MKQRMFVMLDEDIEQFCPIVKKHFGRPLLLRKYLYADDFSGKSCYEILDQFLTKDLGFIRTKVEWCLYI